MTLKIEYTDILGPTPMRYRIKIQQASRPTGPWRACVDGIVTRRFARIVAVDLRKKRKA